MGFLSLDWCGLGWSPWVPFHGTRDDFRLIPAEAGIYRVRPVGQDLLSYLGETGRPLRRRFAELRHGTLAPTMPFNDPHIAAPGHWVLHDRYGFEVEVAAAPSVLPGRLRKGLERYLLWQYRLERGESPLLNLGRYPEEYTRPSNKGQGRSGLQLPDGQKNPAGGPSLPPLRAGGSFLTADWMELTWSEPRPLCSLDATSSPAGPGLYKVVVLTPPELLYVGECISLCGRLPSHVGVAWGRSAVSFSFAEFPVDTLRHQLREGENDLIGAFYEQSGGQIPVYQFIDRSNPPVSGPLTPSVQEDG